MTLSKQTKYGLTFGQILSVLTILGGLFTVWLSLNIRVAQAEVRIENLEKNRIETIQNLKDLKVENKEDHDKLERKLDRILEKVYDNQ